MGKKTKSSTPKKVEVALDAEVRERAGRERERRKHTHTRCPSRLWPLHPLLARLHFFHLAHAAYILLAAISVTHTHSVHYLA